MSSFDLTFIVIALTVGIDVPFLVWLKYGWALGVLAICSSPVLMGLVFVGLQIARLWLLAKLIAFGEQLAESSGNRVMLFVLLVWLGLHAVPIVRVAQLSGLRDAIGITLVFMIAAPMSFLFLSVIGLGVAVRIRSYIKPNGNG